MAITLRDLQIQNDAIVIDWSDGHVSRYDHRRLRIECACAGCVEEMTGERKLDVMSVPGDVFAVDWLQVGNYAVQLAWSDGHTTGIYPYRTLRKLCPCGEDHSIEEAEPPQGRRRPGR